MQQGVVGDMKALGVREAFKSKLQVREPTRAARKSPVPRQGDMKCRKARWYRRCCRVCVCLAIVGAATAGFVVLVVVAIFLAVRYERVIQI